MLLLIVSVCKRDCSMICLFGHTNNVTSRKAEHFLISMLQFSTFYRFLKKIFKGY